MKKELESKNISRETKGTKGLSESASFRKVKEPIQAGKRSVVGGKVEQGRPRGGSSLIMPPSIGKEEIKGEVMVPVRMLTGKEKSNLIARLMHMREVIEKNEVSCDSLSQISEHLLQVEQLITR